MTDEPEIREIDEGVEVIRWDDEWKLLCGCGDIADFDEVIHGHCFHCGATCKHPDCMIEWNGYYRPTKPRSSVDSPAPTP